MSGKTKYSKGATLIEIVIVSFVVTIALVALTNLTMISISRNRQAKEISVATRLAQEGIEWLKGQRNTLGYEQFIVNVPDTSFTYCVNMNSADLNLAFYEIAYPITDTNTYCTVNSTYRRWFVFDQDADGVLVTTYVAPRGKSAEEAIKLSGKLFKW